MTQELKAHEEPLQKVFSSDYDFRIPPYQRPYRWQTDQAIQLLDDLEHTLERSDNEPYFLGSLVLVEAGKDIYDVIDGQQRLTTLTILFGALRDLSTDDVYGRALGAYVTEPGNPVTRTPSKPRLLLREQEAEFFQSYVQNPGKIAVLVGLSDNAADTESKRAIRDNAKVLHERLSAWGEDRRQELATLMTTNTYLVVVATANLDSAYRIFSVMNARGLDLAPTDIFKSEVMSKFPADSDYAKRWEDAEAVLGSEGFTDLFRDVRTIVSGKLPRQELLKEFPDQVLNGYLTAGAAANFVDDLILPYSRAFERTVVQDFGHGAEWEAVNHRLQRLAMIDNKDWRPAALWALKEHSDDAEFLATFLDRLERLAASFLMRGVYTTPRITRYLDLVNELKAGKELSAPALELTDEERRETRNAINGQIYRMQTRRARYVMLRLDELLAKDPGATYKHSIISIEHVLPQTPAEGSQWLADFTEEQRDDWTHRLGNLLLLNRRKNSQARNYDFAAKKSRYFGGVKGSSVFALTTQVLEYETWTPDVIEARQKQLVDLLVHEWQVD
ncbi:DUF262 domain-containing protein [Microlunatus parietis]|uniref:DUF262 domain-containing protein n=1 Tax=Microlunatus parietis TaxID=682979 RepID=A0A7Y9I675_9ACTN|nr:DUF262 domain-containing protein [Microlunatus parietis]NYE70985.1 hypothetical protein [Microlunatus parietis]